MIRSDGSGTSYQFTAYMANQDLADWDSFCAAQHLPADPCPPTSQYPAAPEYTAQDGSDGVANYISQPYNNGAIGYAEAAHGKQYGIPLAFLRNVAGDYTQPTAINTAVALTKAVINADHTQNLLGVYANPDPRTDPMSSYSYMIVPTTLTGAFTDAAQGTTLSRFILYFLCQGQQEAAPLGYSPLPPNLVQLGFDVNAKIPGAVPAPALRDCNNPTITDGFLDNIGTPDTGKVGIPSAGAGGTTPSAVSSTVAISVNSTEAERPASVTSGRVSAGAGTGTMKTTSAPGAGSGAALKAAISTGQAIAAGSGPIAKGSNSGGGTTAEALGSKMVLSAKPVRFGRPWRPMTISYGILIGLVVGAIVAGPPTSVWSSAGEEVRGVGRPPRHGNQLAPAPTQRHEDASSKVGRALWQSWPRRSEWLVTEAAAAAGRRCPAGRFARPGSATDDRRAG